MTVPMYAAVDCGSNSTRLLISDGERSIERLMHITRLGEGVEATGELRADAIERTLAVLARYADVIDGHGVRSTRVAATAALRDSTNAQDFLGPAGDVLGVRPETLTGAQEAELSFLGSTRSLDPADGPWLVVDIGGGSTELAVGSERLTDSISLPVGCVRMTEKHLRHDPPLPEELTSCLAEARWYLEDAARRLPRIPGFRRFVGLAGTITNVAAMELGLREYDPDRIHHFVLTKAAAEEVFRTIATEPLADRVHNPGLERQRADVIVGGCCVLVALMRTFGIEDCLVSEADILDGLVISQVGT